MLYVVYLDEFGHIGPYVSRSDPRYKESPVFGLGGIALPSHAVRHFGTWFYKRKCELLAFEIARDGEHPATWEKKGSALYTTQNVARYPELRHFTNRLLNQIARCGGFVFYVGIQKRLGAAGHDSARLYASVLREAIKRLDDFCLVDDPHQLLIVMDEHPEREQILTQASRSMFGHGNPRRSLIEPPFQVESHRYQTMQAANWICGLVGRWAAYVADPVGAAEFGWAQKYFVHRLRRASRRSGVRRRIVAAAGSGAQVPGTPPDPMVDG